MGVGVRRHPRSGIAIQYVALFAKGEGGIKLSKAPRALQNHILTHRSVRAADCLLLPMPRSGRPARTAGSRQPRCTA